MTNYKDLLIWQKSITLVKAIYELTSAFPKDEQFGLTSQMQRSAVSIPSNIAEGHLRIHKREYLQFLSVALGSAAELETQIIICKSVSKFSKFNFTNSEELLKELMKMLFVYSRRISESL